MVFPEKSLTKKRQTLVQNLISSRILKTQQIIQAFLEVKREEFIPENYRDAAYVDEPLPIGSGQTISAPHMVSIMTELLQPKSSDKVLEIGAGSGYQAAILSRLVKAVYTIELVPELARSARANLKKVGYRNVQIIIGDGSKGWAKDAPYDKIIVTCAAKSIPDKLVEQLKEGGRLAAPIGGEMYQDLILGIKKAGKLETSKHGGCIFVPLRH